MRKLLLASMLMCAGTAMAQTNGYVVDSRGEIVKSGSNLCVHTGYWTPADAIAGCDLAIAQAEPNTQAAPSPVAPTQEATPSTRTVDVVIPAHVLFAFDKAVLSPKGKEALKDALKNNQPQSIRSIKVVGHTDRLGSDAYNNALSKRRAKAVAAYLASSGIASNVITSEGHGKKEPVTTKEDCKKLKMKELRACYAPDRRVDVSFEVAN